MISAYFVHLIILIGIYAILALSLQLALGYGGLLNLGHIAFYGIGAYTFAILDLKGLPFLVCLSAAGLAAMVFGFLLAVPTRKLKGDYLALATLGFSFVTYAVFLNWMSLTRGPLGLSGIPRPVIFGINFFENINFLILTIVIAALVYFVIFRIVTSPFGRVLEATRDDELAARSLGKKTSRIKSIVLAVSALFAGISGALYATYITFIDPSSFTLFSLIPILLMVVVGGLVSLPGTVLGVIVVTLIPELLRFIGFPSSIIGPARQIIYALILLAILNYRPRGFFGKIDLE